MEWCLRAEDDNNIYSPRESPTYRDEEHFTIKLFVGGKIVIKDGVVQGYVGGKGFGYIDCCSVDKLSMLELMAMSKEVRARVPNSPPGVEIFWYHQPNTDFRGCYEIVDDKCVLQMGGWMVRKHPKEDRFVELFSDVTVPIAFEVPETQSTYEGMNTQAENVEFEEGTDWFGEQEMDGHDDANEPVETDSDSSEESFHSDGSNKDESDDDLLFEPNVDHTEYYDNDIGDSDDSSVYMGSDEERAPTDSDDDFEMHYPVFNEADLENPVFEKGLCFGDAKILAKAVKNHAIFDRRPIKRKKNYGKKKCWICEPPCKWRLYASPMQNSSNLQIKTLIPEHTCVQTFYQKQVNSKWLADHYEAEIRMNPTWPVSAFLKKVVNDLKCKVSMHQVYRAKSRALKKINGTHEDQYGLVWKYGHQLKRSVPDSTVKILTSDPEPGQTSGRFERIYVCLGPIKKAFTLCCRKIVGLDGCHLKGPFGGILLSAVGIDANDGMYPIAWAVVEAENNESWNWFLMYLCQDIGVSDNEGAWTFISDRQKGLINALENVVPTAEHRFCVMHLFQNMHKEYKGLALRQLLWLAARSTTLWEFNKHMNKMKEVSPNCYDWLMQKPKEQWSRHAFRQNCHSDMFVNNHCEVFNSSLSNLRDQPIITLLREMHKAIMKRIQIRRDKLVNKDEVLCPMAAKKLAKAVKWAGGCMVTWSGGTSYLVTCTEGGHELVVDLEKRTCTCRKWELTGMPCYHACACIAFKQDDFEPYIDVCYKKANYIKLYSHVLAPIVSPQYWEDAPEPAPLAPTVKTPAGRPKKSRNKQNDVPKEPASTIKLSKAYTKMHCSTCKALGHNARTCKGKQGQKAAEEGGQIPKGKAKNQCKTCGGFGHNARTCKGKEGQTAAKEGATAETTQRGRKKAKKGVGNVEWI